MSMTVSALRANLYKVIDQVLETGNPVEIVRNGRRVRIVPDQPVDKLARLKKRPGIIVGDPEDLVHIDWYDTWTGRDLP